MVLNKPDPIQLFGGWTLELRSPVDLSQFPHHSSSRTPILDNVIRIPSFDWEEYEGPVYLLRPVELGGVKVLCFLKGGRFSQSLLWMRGAESDIDMPLINVQLSPLRAPTTITIISEDLSRREAVKADPVFSAFLEMVEIMDQRIVRWYQRHNQQTSVVLRQIPQRPDEFSVSICLEVSHGCTPDLAGAWHMIQEIFSERPEC